MKTAAQTTFAERLGHTLGQAWRGCARLDRWVRGWLLARGWAPGAANTLLLVVKLAVIGVLLYTAFWLGLVLAFALAGAWIVRNDDGSHDEEQTTDWRYGPAGYGLYTSNEQRIDPHDSEDGKP